MLQQLIVLSINYKTGDDNLVEILISIIIKTYLPK